MAIRTQVFYADGATPVRLGDHIEVRGQILRFRTKSGRINYLPGTSRPNPEMEYDGRAWAGVQFDDGTYSGVLIDPDRNYCIREGVSFKRRGSTPIRELPYNENPDNGSLLIIPELMDTMDRPPIHYSDGSTQILIGDHIEVRACFRKIRARIVYVPGISKFNEQVEFEGEARAGARADDGKFLGVYVDPTTNRVLKYFRFQKRGTTPVRELQPDENPYDPPNKETANAGGK